MIQNPKFSNGSDSKLSQKVIASVRQYAELVRNSTEVTVVETEPEKQARIKHLLADPRAFQEYYFPNLKHTPDYIIKPARRVLSNPECFEWWMMFRGARKSTWLNVIIPMMLLAKGELEFMMLVGSNENFSKRWLGNIQAQLENNQRFINDFGHQQNYGNWAEGEFLTTQGVAFVALGMGQSPRGVNISFKRPNYIVVSDIDSKELSKNPARCREMYHWLMEDILGTEEAGGDGIRFIFDNNYFSKTSVGHLLMSENPEVHITRVDVLDKGGRPAADFLTLDWIKKKKKKIGYRAFMREYMNTPIQEGAIYKTDWILWAKVPPLSKCEYVVSYFDPAFKGKKANDFSAIVLVAKSGRHLYITKAFCRQTTLGVAVRWHYDLAQQLHQQGVYAYHMVEAGFVQDMLLDAEYQAEGQRRGWYMDILKDTSRKGNKQERIEAASIKFENGLVLFNEKERASPDMATGIDQLLAFEKGSSVHDDFPDALEAAISWVENRSRNSWGNAKPKMGKRPLIKNDY